ncbi:MAG TPA: VCBS repeat-containing protein, partial [Planctomycetota bacterium]|nr:VCBS repeat-containing protein [Planctomycetota bacterium]
RFGLRTGAPTLAPILEDVNRDGRLDLVLPGLERCELWLDGGADEQGRPTFARAAAVRVDSAVLSATEDAELSDRYECRLAIPQLATQDVDGDGRPDLVVEEGSRTGYHLQREDGSLPEAPDVSVDLSIFRDPGAGDGDVRPGGTLTMGGDATLASRDLDGDGRLDFVIAQGRKVWVFHGGPDGPQFEEPSTILKSADDVTQVLTLDLDETDTLPDLLLVRVVVPSIPTLIFGLFSEWDVEIRLAGYRNDGGRRFATEPAWKVDARLRLPPIFDVVRDPFAFVQRFEQAARGFRQGLDGSFLRPGGADLALLSEDRRRVDLWRGRDDAAESLDRAGLEALLRRELFG